MHFRRDRRVERSICGHDIHGRARDNGARSDAASGLKPPQDISLAPVNGKHGPGFRPHQDRVPSDRQSRRNLLAQASCPLPLTVGCVEGHDPSLSGGDIEGLVRDGWGVHDIALHRARPHARFLYWGSRYQTPHIQIGMPKHDAAL